VSPQPEFSNLTSEAKQGEQPKSSSSQEESARIQQLDLAERRIHADTAQPRRGSQPIMQRHTAIPCIEKDDLPCSQFDKKEHRQPRNRGQLLSPVELDNHARPAPNKEREHMPKRVICSFNRHPLNQSASTAHIKT